MQTPLRINCPCCDKLIHPSEHAERVEYVYNPDTGGHDLYVDGIFNTVKKTVTKAKNAVKGAFKRIKPEAILEKVDNSYLHSAANKENIKIALEAITAFLNATFEKKPPAMIVKTREAAWEAAKKVDYGYLTFLQFGNLGIFMIMKEAGYLTDEDKAKVTNLQGNPVDWKNAEKNAKQIQNAIGDEKAE